MQVPPPASSSHHEGEDDHEDFAVSQQRCALLASVLYADAEMFDGWRMNRRKAIFKQRLRAFPSPSPVATSRAEFSSESGSPSSALLLQFLIEAVFLAPTFICRLAAISH